MGKDNDFIDGFGLGFHDEFDDVNPELIEFSRKMNEIILPEIKFTEVIQQSSDDLNREK